MTTPKYYITTAISYPNGAPHIGHAYEAIATDALARFKRLDGYDVRFMTGTDEHGLKMVQTAKGEGIDPKALADRNVPRFQEMVAVLGCSNQDFIRTSEARHHRASQALWQRMADNDDIYKDTYSGWYSVRDEAYYEESETELRTDGVRYGRRVHLSNGRRRRATSSGSAPTRIVCSSSTAITLDLLARMYGATRS